MQHKGTVVLETDRLVLRRFRADDSAPAYNNWCSDDKVTKYLRWPTHASVKVTQEIVNEWVNGYKEQSFYQWAITLKAEGDEPIGSIGVVEQNEEIGILHIGYCIGSKYWHRGITSEALQGILGFLFREVGARRIASWHDPDNANSGKVMQKCGLVYEGTLRKADISNRGIIDAAVYSILAEEYLTKG